MGAVVPDLRMPLVGAAAWAGALVGLAWPTARLVATLGVLVLVTLVLRWGQGRRPATWSSRIGAWRLVVALVLVAAAAGTAAQVRVHRVSHNPVATLAQSRAAVVLDLAVSSDPRLVGGRFDDQIVLRGRVDRVAVGSTAHEVSVPVVVLAPVRWAKVRLGERVRFSGRLAPSEDRDLAAVVRPLGPPQTLQAPAWWWDAAHGVRTALRASVADVPADRRALVPALVVGDDQDLDQALADDFRTTGLTHLLAVSGTNLTLVLGFLLVLARLVGVRGRGMHLVGACGVVGFVILARPEPSVLRAAVMGSVALAALGSGGTRRGGRSLGVAVAGLLLVDPWLAPTPGFTLSVLATAGIVFVAPVWRDALSGWMPRWLAEAVAVPAAAQLACTPVVAALSGQVSLVSVIANLLAAPAVGPTTVLGLGAGLTGLVWPLAGRVLGVLAGGFVAWIVAVARHGAALPLPALDWGRSGAAVATLTALCLLALLLVPRMLRHRAVTSAGCILLAALVLIRAPTPGWPPEGWVVAMCDVGQGDALVLRAADGAGVVIDAGPEPALVDECLRGLDIDRVPLLVLTHFHADHVDGMAGVARGRRVSAVEVTGLADPPGAARAVSALAGRLGAPPALAPYASTRRIGDVTLEAVWPRPDHPSTGPGDGSTANNASVVLLAEVRGVRILLTGDLEPPGQEALARSLPGLAVDVLKVPHHGSRYQDLDFLTTLGAQVALVSAGADNDYGHPAEETLAALEDAGSAVFRTDRSGDVAVTLVEGRLEVERHP